MTKIQDFDQNIFKIITMKYLLSMALVLSFFYVQAEDYTVTVTEMQRTVNKINRTGLGTTLNLQKKDVKSLWKKKLKEYGKVESKGDEFILDQATIPSISSKTVRVVARVESSGKGTIVWWAIDLGDKWVVSGGTGHKAATDILKKFGMSAYKEDINKQIEEAEKALKKTEKERENTEKDGENLVSDLKSNADEKVKLENQLKKNGEDKIKIEKDIVQNKKDQEAMKKKVEQQVRAVEVVKAKLDKVK